MAGFGTILGKDLRLEARSGDSTITLVVLSLLILVVLVLAFNLAGTGAAEVAAGSLWLALILAGMLGANRSQLAERDNGCIYGLLLSPIEAAAIYAAKLAAAAIFMAVAELATTIMLVLFFNLDFGAPLFRLAPIVALGVLGFAAVSTLLAAISSRTRAGELLLPLLVVPVFVPALIAGVKASAAVLAGGSLGQAATWLKLLIAFDVLFVAAGYLLFEYVVIED